MNLHNKEIIEKFKKERRISIYLEELFSLENYFGDPDENGYYRYVDFEGLMNLKYNPRKNPNIRLNYYMTCGNLFKRITGCFYRELDSDVGYNISCAKGDTMDCYNFFFGSRNEDGYATKLIFGLNGQYIETGFDNNAFFTVEKANASLKLAKEALITIYFE